MNRSSHNTQRSWCHNKLFTWPAMGSVVYGWLQMILMYLSCSCISTGQSSCDLVMMEGKEGNVLTSRRRWRSMEAPSKTFCQHTCYQVVTLWQLCGVLGMELCSGFWKMARNGSTHLVLLLKVKTALDSNPLLLLHYAMVMTMNQTWQLYSIL